MTIMQYLVPIAIGAVFVVLLVAAVATIGWMARALVRGKGVVSPR